LGYCWAGQQQKPYLVKEGFLCPFSEGNAKWGGDPDVTFEPPMNHLSTLYEVPLNPMKPPPFPP